MLPCGKCGSVPPFSDGSRCQPHRIVPELGYVEGNVVPRCPLCHSKEPGHSRRFTLSAYRAGKNSWLKNPDEHRKKVGASQCGKPKPTVAGDNNPAKRLVVRAKISAALKGRTSCNKGKHFSPEHRAKISAANIGKHFSPDHPARHKTPEWLAKIGAANKGRHLTPEHCAKISAANIGRHRPQFTPEWRAKISAAQKGKRHRGMHTLWHIRRGIVNPRCQFCRETA